MNIVYYSNLFFSDCDFPLIKEFQHRNINVVYYINVVIGRQCGGLFDLRKHTLQPGIFPASAFKEIAEFADYLDISYVYIVCRTPKLNDIRNWKVYKELAKRISIFKPTVVHLTGELGLSECFLYLFRRKMVLTVHDPFMHSGEANALSEKKRKIAFKLANKIILLNDNQRDKFLSFYKVHIKKVFSNRLGVYDALNFLYARKSRKMDLPQNYILFFGHISPYKGIDTLCEAMTIVRKTCPNLKCIIAGSGKLYFDFTPYKTVENIILYNRFIDTTELVSLISNSLFVVCPYKDATQSGVVSSAFTFSKPVLATEVGGLGETVVKGKTGELVPPCNAMALADAIVRMTRNEQRLKDFSTNIEDLFKHGNRSWPTIADKYIYVYSTQL